MIQPVPRPFVKPDEGYVESPKFTHYNQLKQVEQAARREKMNLTQVGEDPKHAANLPSLQFVRSPVAKTKNELNAQRRVADQSELDQL